MEKIPCELCGKPSEVTMTIALPYGIMRGDVCFQCWGNSEDDGEIALKLMDLRLAEAQEVFGLEYPISEEHPVPKELAQDVLYFALNGHEAP